jgi:hypothetical protein
VDLPAIELEPAGGSGSSSRRSVAVGFWIVIVALGVGITWAALRDRPPNAELPYYLPTYLPPNSHTQHAWSRDPGYEQPDDGGDTGTSVHYGGVVDAGGRLVRWMSLDTGSDSFNSTSTVDVAGEPQPILHIEGGELRMKLNVAGCESVEATAVGFDVDQLASVAATARCVGGYVVVDAPADQTELCRVDRSASKAWEMETTEQLGNGWSVGVHASRTDCPEATWTGIPRGGEHFEEIAGRRTLLYVAPYEDKHTWAWAGFQDGDLWVGVTVFVDHTDGVEAELRRIVEGLQRVDADTWHEANHMAPLPTD